ncbi:1,4-alpha-glucan branching protein GlgB [Luteitalea sp.]
MTERGRTEVHGDARYDVTLVTGQDLHLFNEGTHYRAYRVLGAHVTRAADGTEGVCFAVWAPNAASVSVMGDFNEWRTDAHRLRARDQSGVWEAFVPGVGRGTRYKYHVVSRTDGYSADKADPFAVRHEVPPHTGSVVWDLDYTWQDAAWMESRARRQALASPIAIYEMHLGSWMREGGEDAWPSYRDVAPRLADHVERLGFTHVEFLPLTEHPFYGSWGYQTTGYFAPTSRYGTPQDFMALVDHLHQRGIGVILDWVPSHFPTDEHGLSYFDGTHLFEHADPRQGLQRDWNSYVFNYGRHEVRSFLMSSAFCWLEQFHIDGLRVDAVASMLYLDYSRGEGEWLPNEHGGRENLEAMAFLRRFNEDIYREHPDVQTYAEESTAWPLVSRPTSAGGLGFGFKWDMGWMHDTLQYMARDPMYRRHHHGELTFRGMYAYSENFVLPLSHDEVVHGKRSLLGKMPGDAWQQFANLRLLYAWMYAQPGKKLLFMGAEFAQGREWNHDSALEWVQAGLEPHAQIGRWLQDLNGAYRSIPALHEGDTDPEGFAWVDTDGAEHSVVAFLRRGRGSGGSVLALFNFTPVPRPNYQVGVPVVGRWLERLNSDARLYGGAGWGNLGGVETSPIGRHGHPQSLTVTLPPLGALFFTAPG